jgi:hypothetical protein
MLAGDVGMEENVPLENNSAFKFGDKLGVASGVHIIEAEADNDGPVSKQEAPSALPFS